MKSIKTRLVWLILLAIGSSAANSTDTPVTKVVHDPKVTHLNVRAGQIVNLDTFCITQDGNKHTLYFDRSSKPFEIPQGYSFVVTDIIVYPAFCTLDPDPNARWVFLLEGSLGRHFQVAFRGDTTMHYGLTGGLAYGPDNLPAVRMLQGTELNSALLDVQVLGYFVKGNAMPVFPG